MKKTIFILTALCLGLSARAQDAQNAAAEAAMAILEAPREAEQPAPEPDYWTKSVVFDLGFNQTGLTNWAAGGYNTLTLAAGIDAKADYAKELMSWSNRLQLNYGFLWSADKKDLLQKSTDRIYLESKWAYDLSEKSKWKYTASFDFRSQFTDSYDNYKNLDDAGNEVPWYGTLKSGLMAPAYTNLALGLEWKPAEWFNVNIAPVTGGFTICTVDDLRKGYGMKLKDDTLDPAVGSNYRSLLFQFGAQIKANFKATINDKFIYDTQLVLFTDYLNNPFEWTRVNWDNKITWTLSKLFKVGLDTWLIYDPIVTIDDCQSKVQFKEFISINFTYTIASK